jgi:hypothetical protein
MRFIISSLTIFSLVGFGLALGTPLCMFQRDVDRMVEVYTLINSAWDNSYADYIATDFRDTSDSINILSNKPLGSVTFATKAAYITFQQNRVRNLDDTPGTSCT